MELEQIFYAIAGVFVLAAIIYFAWEYIEVLPRVTKTFLLFGLAILLFMVANMLKGVKR